MSERAPTPWSTRSHCCAARGRRWTGSGGSPATPSCTGDAGAVAFDRGITVPFAPETPASGVGWTGPLRRAWYRRELPGRQGDRRTVLHLGAVDRLCDVWVGGQHVAHHEGGYTPFAVDVTDALGDGGAAARRPRRRRPGRPRGPAREAGLARRAARHLVPAHHRASGGPCGWSTSRRDRIADVQWRGDPASLRVDVRVELARPVRGARLHVRLRLGDRLLADDVVRVDGSVVERSMTVGDGSIDDRSAAAVGAAVRRRPGGRRRARAGRRRRRGARRGGELPRAALGRRRGRPVPGQRPAGAAADGARPGLLAGTPAPPRPTASALQADLELAVGARVHRRAQAPEDRGPALAGPRRPDGPAGVGGDALGVPARDRRRPRGCCASGPSSSPPTAGTRAWSPGCRSTRAGACPRRRPTPRSGRWCGRWPRSPRALDGTRPVSADDGWEALGGEVLGVHDYEQDAAALADRYRTGADLERDGGAAAPRRAAGRPRPRGHRRPRRRPVGVRRGRAAHAAASRAGGTPRRARPRTCWPATATCGPRCTPPRRWPGRAGPS